MITQTFPGYDEKSPTLRPSPRNLNSNCMRGIIPDEVLTYYTDSAPQIYSGDFVRLWIQYPDGFQVILKRLRVSRAGTWWLECADGVAQIGTLIRPFAIDKVVAFDTEPLMRGPFPPVRKASEEEAKHYAMLAEDVVREWRELGHIDGVPFPGLNRINYFLPDNTSTKNPDYRPPEPLQ